MTVSDFRTGRLAVLFEAVARPFRYPPLLLLTRDQIPPQAFRFKILRLPAACEDHVHLARRHRLHAVKTALPPKGGSNWGSHTFRFTVVPVVPVSTLQIYFTLQGPISRSKFLNRRFRRVCRRCITPAKRTHPSARWAARWATEFSAPVQFRCCTPGSRRTVHLA